VGVPFKISQDEEFPLRKQQFLPEMLFLDSFPKMQAFKGKSSIWYES
jgi:hypothetical protein